jgi:gliding motility-associated-like protein
VGITTNTFIVTDAAGNTATCSFTVTVNDNENPTLTCPANITVNNDAGLCSAVVTYNVPFNDNCPGSTIAQTAGLASGAAFPVGITTNTFVVTDAAGNTATCSFTVTVNDNENPTLTCPANITVNNDAGLCSAIVSYSVPFNDNCPGSTIAQTAGLASGAAFPKGITTNTFVVTDAAGNTATCSFTVTVNDNENPTLTCPANITVNNDAGLCSAVVTYSVPFNDNCPGSTIAQTAGLASGAAFPKGITTNTFIVTDAAGNTATCSFTVTVNDNENPGIICPSNITVNNDLGICGAYITYNTPTIGDNCLNIALTVTQTKGLPSGSLFPLGITINEFIVEDAAGNKDTCEFSVRVFDNENPTLTCPANITVNNDAGQCSAVVTYNVPFNDNCPGSTIAQTAGLASGAAFPVGITTNTFIVTDAAGNTATCSFTVTVIDNEGPGILCPANITRNNDNGICGAIVTYNAPTYGDNCNGSAPANVIQTKGLASGSLFPVGTTINEFVVIDASGNRDTCEFSVTVIDNENPTITCPSNITQTADAGVCNAAVTIAVPQTGDNCGVQSVTNSYTGTADASATYPVGITTVTYTVTDIHGNSSTCSFTVTITDDENPTITCPSNITQTADAGECDAAVAIAVPQTGDNCGVQSVVNSYTGTADASGTYPVGTTTVTYTVTDIHGNSSTCSFTVTITDNENPTITCPSNITQTADAGECDAAVTVPQPQVDDNCGIRSVLNNYTGQTDASGTYPVGTTTVTYTITDIHGNSSTCSFTVTITDNENPTITCPSNITQTADAGECDAAVTIAVPQTGDNCGVQSVTNSYTGTADASGTYPVGTTTVTYTITDIHGNSATCSFTVTITDDENPTITCPSNITQTADAGVCNAAVAIAVPQTGDNCGVQSVTNSYTGTADASGTYPVGTTTVTYTVTDIHGNSSTCSFTVTITDDENPTITCPANITQTADAGECDAAVTIAVPQTGDNCGVQSVTNSYTGSADASGTYPVGTTTVTYTITDIHGNSSTCSFTVTITDDENPTITCPANISVNNDPGVCGATVTFNAPQTNDNCGVQSTVQTAGLPSGSLFPIGTTTNTFVVTDIHGNTATCSFTVTVTDNEGPRIVCPANISVNNDAGLCSAVVTYNAPAFSDNCNGQFPATVTQLAGLPSGSVFPVGTTTNRFRVDDQFGNSDICEFTVTVTDNENPTITCPADITVSLPTEISACDAQVTVPAPQTGDNCGVQSIINSYNQTADASGTYFVGTTTVTFTVTDIYGNTAQCQFTVTLTDDGNPTIICPANITQTADPEVCNAAVTIPQPQATDNCGVQSITNDYTGTADASGTYPVGTTTVTYTVTDIHGNSSQCQFTVTVTDDENPTITCPSNITQTADPEVCNAAVTIAVPQANDNCGVQSVTNSYTGTADASGTYPVGTTTVTYTVTDIHGNSTTCSFTVTVTDDEAPAITCPADIVVNNDAEVCGAVVTFNPPTADDNCPGITQPATITQTAGLPSGSVFPVGITTNTFVATDGAGNTTTCSFTVRVIDNEAPVFLTCPANINVVADSNDCNPAVIWDIPQTTDNCFVSSTVSTHDSGDNFPVGTTIVTYTISDTSGNTATCSFEVTIQPRTLLADYTVSEYACGYNVSCNGNADGSIDLYVQGGCLPYTYLWRNQATTEDLSGLTAGTYDVTVTDNNGSTVSVSVTITEPAQLTLTSTSSVYQGGYNITCNGANDGSIDITIAGGCEPYSFAWSNQATSEDISNLTAGTYDVTVTDENGCTVSQSFTLTQPDILTIASAQITNVNCTGGNDGAIDITITGGSEPFSIYWSNNATTEDISGLTAGVYQVFITDANGCSFNATYSISENAQLLLSAGITNALCGQNNGSATVSVSGGATPYTINWSNSETTATINNLAPGNYTVTVADANGCSGTRTVTVNDVGTLSITASITQPGCGINDGEIDITVSGAAGNLTFNWSNNFTTEDISGLGEGTYNLTVTSGSCSVTYSATLIATPQINISGTPTNSNCGQNDGSIIVTGTGNYTYLWSNGATVSTLNNLAAGVYNVTATDANGCSVAKEFIITDIDGPAVTAVTQNASCGNNDGFIELSITGGSTPSFNWSHGPTTQDVNGLAPADYTVTVTDNDGCQTIGYFAILGSTEITVYADKYEPLCYGNNNGSIDITPIGGSGSYSYAWSNNETTQDISSIGIGTYSVSVTDANGCSATTAIIIEQPDTLIASINVSQYIGGNGVSCNGASDGNLDLTVQGGTVPYYYDWSTGDTIQDIFGLDAGTYTVTVADSNGCIAIVTAEITQPDSVQNTLSASTYDGGYNVSCNGAEDGSITVIANGGIAPYSYIWSTTDTFSSINEVGAGTYNVTVTDANGCSAVSSITLTQPDILTATAQGSELPCSGSGNGTIDLTVQGGTADYTYIWSNTQTTEDLSGLASGIYTVTVTDENGCTAVASAEVIDVNPLDLSGTIIDNPTCIDSKDGYIAANVTGGTQPYSYLWSTGATTNAIDSLDNGNFILTVTDANGCSVVSNYTIAGPICNLPPVAVQDIASITCESTVDIAVLDNDSDPDGDNFFIRNIISNPTNGTVVVNTDGTVTYTPAEDFVGLDSFIYEICDDAVSTPFCDTATVYITVLACRPNVFIPNGFSPNGDGYNDYWEIIDITNYPKAEVLIFNRWGNKVYEASPYQNDWNGVNMDGEGLPDGTYYYIINLNDDDNTVYTGYVVINRGK